MALKLSRIAKVNEKKIGMWRQLVIYSKTQKHQKCVFFRLLYYFFLININKLSSLWAEINGVGSLNSRSYGLGFVSLLYRFHRFSGWLLAHAAGQDSSISAEMGVVDASAEATPVWA